MAVSPDQIFRARLQLELEPADYIIRKLLSNSYETNTFVFLRSAGDRFWNELVKGLEIIHQWSQHLGVPEDFSSLKMHIWENFLCRLSLDERYITEPKTHGNKVLQILVESVQTTLYSKLSISGRVHSSGIPPSVIPQNVIPPSVVIPHQQQPRQQPPRLPQRTPIRIRKSKETIQYKSREPSSNKGSRSKKRLPFQKKETESSESDDDEEEEREEREDE